MSEYIPPPDQLIKQAYFPNTENTLIELHRLLAIFLSSRHFAELYDSFPLGERFDPILKIQEVEEDEITRILLNLAITARVIDDREGRAFQLIGSNCGRLQKDVRNQAVDVLEIREACNKIIHAETVRFDCEGDPSYLNPILYLYGTLQASSWRAELDVVKFCKEYVTIVCKSERSF